MGRYMNTKLKVPCWVVDIESGQVLRCRLISRPNPRMKRENNWKGLVCHVQNENGTGIVEYSKVRPPTDKELEEFNEKVKKRFGI